jgi:hypothetical protein
MVAHPGSFVKWTQNWRFGENAGAVDGGRTLHATSVWVLYGLSVCMLSGLLSGQVAMGIDDLILDDAHRLVDGCLIGIIHVHVIGRELVHGCYGIVQ